MKRLDSLEFADIFRDGGSFEARFRTDDGSRFVVYLEAHPSSPARGSLRHGRLFAYEGDEMPLDAVSIAKGSTEEHMLLQQLGLFLQSPKVTPDHREPEYAIEHLKDMITSIPQREKD